MILQCHDTIMPLNNDAMICDCVEVILRGQENAITASMQIDIFAQLIGFQCVSVNINFLVHQLHLVLSIPSHQ